MSNTKNKSDKLVTDFMRRRKRRAWRKRALALMAALVVFCTTYVLIINASTREAAVYCGKEEHVHGNGCYTEQIVFICGQEADASHEHTDECCFVEREWNCKMEEHVHSLQCYSAPDGEDSAPDEVLLRGPAKAPEGVSLSITANNRTVTDNTNINLLDGATLHVTPAEASGDYTLIIKSVESEVPGFIWSGATVINSGLPGSAYTVKYAVLDADGNEEPDITADLSEDCTNALSPSVLNPYATA